MGATGKLCGRWVSGSNEIHKYVLNTNTGIIHIYEGLHYNPTYEIEKAAGCRDLPALSHAYDLCECDSPQLAGMKAREHHPTMELHFCQKCFGLSARILDAFV